MKYTAEQVAEFNQAASQVSIEIRNRNADDTPRMRSRGGHFTCDPYWDCLSPRMSHQKKYKSFYAFGLEKTFGQRVSDYWLHDANQIQLDSLHLVVNEPIPYGGFVPLMGGVWCPTDTYYATHMHHWANAIMSGTTQNLSRALTSTSRTVVVRLSTLDQLTSIDSPTLEKNEALEMFLRLRTSPTEGQVHQKSKVSLTELISSNEDVHDDLFMLTYRGTSTTGTYVNPEWLLKDGEVLSSGHLNGAILKPGYDDYHNEIEPIAFAATPQINNVFWKDQRERYNATYGFTPSSLSESWSMREGELDFADLGF